MTVSHQLATNQKLLQNYPHSKLLASVDEVEGMDVMNGGKIQSMTVNHLLAINRILYKSTNYAQFLASV